MLLKFISITNVGRFRNCKSGGDTQFRKMTLLFGENGRGKTTLCEILKSLHTGQGDLVLGRVTLGQQDVPSVELRLENGNVSFRNGAWTATLPSISVFDSAFVHSNVHSGDAVSHEHKRNLYRVIVGEQGVRLAKQIEELDSQIRNTSRDISTKQAVAEAFLPKGLSLKDFLAIQEDKQVAQKIVAKQSEITALESAGEIKAKPFLKELQIAALPEQFEQVLSKSLQHVARDAEQRVRGHIRSYTTDATESWLATGVGFVKDELCPFCGKDNADSDIFTAYKAFFSEEYNALKKEIVEMRETIDALPLKISPQILEEIVAGNSGVADYWRRFVPLAVPMLKLEHYTRTLLLLWVSADSLLAKKLAAPLEMITKDEEFHAAAKDFAEACEDVSQYNVAVRFANEAIGAKKKDADVGDLHTKRMELLLLQTTHLRHEEKPKQACQVYVGAIETKKRLEADKEAAKKELDEHSETVLDRYQGRINKLLTLFGAGFRIGNTTRSYVGGTPSAGYQIVINNVQVDLGDETTPASKPSFRNTLSAGDKSTLALAFFLAQLEGDPALPTKTVVLDDPFSSQDRSRRACTQQLLCKLASKAKQVIILSHDQSFLRLVWDGIQDSGSKKALQVKRFGGDSIISEWDIEASTKPDYLQKHALLKTYQSLGGDNQRQVAQSIRLLMEEYLRMTFPDQFGETEWLGDFIGKIRGADTYSPLSSAQPYIDEIEAINDYSKRYHHGSNSGAESEPINDGELSAYVTRTLDLIEGF